MLIKLTIVVIFYEAGMEKKNRLNLAFHYAVLITSFAYSLSHQKEKGKKTKKTSNCVTGVSWDP